MGNAEGENRRLLQAAAYRDMPRSPRTPRDGNRITCMHCRSVPAWKFRSSVVVEPVRYLQFLARMPADSSTATAARVRLLPSRPRPTFSLDGRKMLQNVHCYMSLSLRDYPDYPLRCPRYE